jgi:Zn-dependent protease with chaperone function
MVLFLGALVTGALLSWATAWLELIRWRRAAGVHWTERARLLVPARAARQLNITFLGMIAAFSALALLDERTWWPAFLGGIFGALVGGLPVEREIDPTLTVRTWLHVIVAMLVVSFLRLSSVGIAIVLMPYRLNGRAAFIVAAFLLLQLALEFGLSVRLLQWLRLLRPASPRVQAIVDECSARLGVDVRAAWELRLPQANAVAFVATREVAFTPKLVALASDAELRTVCAHELGHIGETKWTRFGRVIGSLMFFPLVFLQPAIARFGPSAAPALMAAVFVIIVLRARLGRAMEKRADRIAIESAEEKAVYARVLEKIYRANQIPAVLARSRLRPHPDLYDRMLAAGVTPDYPRPQPPPRMRWSSLALLLIAIGLGVVAALRS